MTRALTTIARLANDRPWTVLAALAAVLVAVAGLAVLGAVSLVLYPTAPKWLAFAAIALAVTVTSRS